MRCLTLADGLKQHGAQIRFISRHLPEYLCKMLLEKGHELALLESPRNEKPLDELAHAHWLGVSQAQDGAESIRALSGESWDWLVVDHYALDYRWEAMLGQVVGKILVIDDIADRQHDCDVLLDQNFYADMETRYVGKVPERCRLLLGPRYAVLRDEFRRLHEKMKPRGGTVKHILVFFGGVDTDNNTGSAILALSKIELPGLHVDVVIGAQHPCREQIEDKCRQFGFTCHVQTDRMAELMAAADLAIGAGGSATWERCALGLPSIIMELADNQRKAARDLEGAGVLVNLGDAKKVTIQGLADRVRSVIENQKLRLDLSKASLNLMSFSRQNNVVEFLIGHHV